METVGYYRHDAVRLGFRVLGFRVYRFEVMTYTRV